jgi:hypothetical protein
MWWRKQAPGPLASSAARSLLAAPRRALVLEWEPNPSSDQLVLPWLAHLGWPTVVNHDAVPDLAAGDLVVIVRYLTPAWRAAIEARREHLAGVVYFMDDDLWDRDAWVGLPRDYRGRLKERALRHRRWIQRHCDALWVSTEALGAKYAAWSPRVLPLAPGAANLAQVDAVQVAYHGTASHGAEIEWLHPVMAEVLARCPQVHFELFGDKRVAALYRELPRVAVLHPMRWPGYLAYSAATRRQIGLAPLLPTPFNAARGAVKFFDFARMGAVGVYSARPPYQGFVRDGIDGLLLPNEPAHWVEALVSLAGDRTRMRVMAEAARERALAAAGAP